VFLSRVFAKVPSSVVIASVIMAVLTSVIATGPITKAFAFSPGSGTFVPGDLLVSTSQWQQNANVTAGTTQLPPNCGVAPYTAATCATAVAGGTYPYVFDNDAVDGSFGVAQPIVIDEITPTGTPVDSVTVPNSLQSGITSSSDQMVTSFSSKSELALNQSTDGSYITFMGYNAPVGTLDASNSDTPGDLDHTNSDSATPTYRVVAQMDQYGNPAFTETNAYSGNNGRAAILDPSTNTILTVGNAGNGANPEPQTVVQGVGSQIMSLASGPEASQSPGQPTPAGNFNITQLGLAADKSAKDDNFRGLTANNGVLYFSKGSGSNGVNTVYFLDTTGTACPSGGVGVPASGATLPVAGSFTSPTYTANGTDPELTPTNTCILKGLPTVLAKSAPKTGVTGAFDFPFGIWFANSTTMYVADEGSGDSTYSASTGPLGEYTIAAGQTNAGLQKWSFNGTQWVLDYVLQNGLSLGQPYGVSGYPSGPNTYTVGATTTTVGQQWDPATDGVRNLTGKVNSNGTVSIWASTSTVSGSGDQGADPNALVSITDTLSDTTASQASGETFSTVMTPANEQVIRGAVFVPTTPPDPNLPETPWVPLLPIAAALVGTGVFFWHRRLRHRYAA
jgi:hypothetical protein